MDNIDFNSMNDDELNNFIAKATEEKNRRMEELKEIYWERAKRALLEYVNRFGDIDIRFGDYYISPSSDFSHVGAIH